MSDIFNEHVMCSKCGKEMDKRIFERDGFKLRGWQCQYCGKRILHPADEEKYKDFKRIKKKIFKVKLRMVGNSYAVSIPKEVISFMREQEKLASRIVKLCIEEAKKLALIFNEFE